MRRAELFKTGKLNIGDHGRLTIGKLNFNNLGEFKLSMVPLLTILLLLVVQYFF